MRSKFHLRLTLSAAAILGALSLAPVSHAQDAAPATPAAAEPMAAPDLSPSVTRLLEADYLSDEDKTALRLFHGIWTPADLATPEHSARAALVSFDLANPTLDPGAASAVGSALDRAEAALLRGRLADALRLVELARQNDAQPTRAARIQARALEAMGRDAQAVQVCDTEFKRLSDAPQLSDEEIVEGVLLAELQLRLKDPLAPADGAIPAKDAPARVIGRNFEGYMQALALVRDRNRLYWPARLAEAELLLARDNPAQAQQALTEVLALNPRCARAWELLGQMTVASFNFDLTEKIATRLDLLAAERPDDAPGDTDTAHASPIPASEAGQRLRARALLRQINGDAALALLDPLIRSGEASIETRALAAAAAATAFHFDDARSRLADLDAFAGGPTLAGFLEVGAALAEARQYAESARFLEEAARRRPFDAQAFSELGLMELQAGRDQRSLDALEKAHALDPFNVRVDNSLRLVRELLSYATLQSEHFAVRYRPGIDQILAAEMLPALEAMYATVTGPSGPGIGFEPAGVDNSGRTLIDLMPDHEWFAVRIAGMPKIHTIAASTGPVVAMEAPREGPGHTGTYDWIRTVRHEFTHTVTLGRTRNRIPLWFTEAAAQHLELGPRDFNTAQLLARVIDTEALFDFDAINIAFVRPKKPSDRAQGYAQGLWMYEFIVERFGEHAPIALMDQYAAGVREEQAFENVLHLTRDQFMDQFRPWARAQAESWGLLLPQGTPSVTDLLMRAIADDAIKNADKPAPPPPTPDDRAAAPDAAPPQITDAQLDDWLKQYPNHPDLLELKVDRAVAAAGGRATPALEPLLEQYAAARPVDDKPHRLLAQMYLAQSAQQNAAPDRPDQEADRRAITHLAFLDDREQYTPVYAMEIARRLSRLGDQAGAMRKAERAVSIAPYDPRPRELAATIAVRLGDLTTAERHILALTRIEPDRDIHRRRLEALRGKMSPPAPQPKEKTGGP